jgi:hypothetical protein
MRKDAHEPHRKSAPFFPQFVKPCFPKILGRHCNPGLTICVEIYVERFSIHRCHKKEFFLKMVTSNYIHLVVRDKSE